MTNKTTKTIIIALIAIVVIGAIYLLLFKKPEVNIEQGETTTTTTAASTSINCQADSNCLSTNFLSCKPLDFTMGFVQPGSQYIITVLGKEGEKCHYFTKVLNPNGSILMGYDCKVPLTEISADIVKHFFGQDTGSAKETQTQLQGTYCTALQS